MSAPLPRVLNKYRDGAEIGKNSIYIGRPSKWGNPFAIGIDGDRETVIEKYKVWFFNSGLMNEIEELRGKDLVCFCKPKKCHGDFLLEIANK